MFVNLETEFIKFVHMGKGSVVDSFKVNQPNYLM